MANGRDDERSRAMVPSSAGDAPTQPRAQVEKPAHKVPHGRRHGASLHNSVRLRSRPAHDRGRYDERLVAARGGHGERARLV